MENITANMKKKNCGMGRKWTSPNLRSQYYSRNKLSLWFENLW